jgi:hypothetical protein
VSIIEWFMMVQCAMTPKQAEINSLAVLKSFLLALRESQRVRVENAPSEKEVKRMIRIRSHSRWRGAVSRCRVSHNAAVQQLYWEM